MKTLLKFTFLFFPLTSLSGMAARAQGFFNQQGQKVKLMVAQIAGYELYLKGLKQAYTMADKGLKTAHDLKNDTFNLHSSYINSLSQVTPAIRDDPKGKAIAELYQQLITLFQTEINWQQQQQILNTADIKYLKKVGDNLQAKAKLDMDELNQVLTPGKLQLTDAQRLDRLDHLYDAMKDKQAFAAYFTAKCRKVAQARQQEQKEKEQVKKLYGIQ